MTSWIDACNGYTGMPRCSGETLPRPSWLRGPSVAIVIVLSEVLFVEAGMHHRDAVHPLAIVVLRERAAWADMPLGFIRAVPPLLTSQALDPVGLGRRGRGRVVIRPTRRAGDGQQRQGPCGRQ